MDVIMSTRYRVDMTSTPGQDGPKWTPTRVARLRKLLGLSQSAFAAELGVRQQTVSE